jgi:hypothetical protein
VHIVFIPRSFWYESMFFVAAQALLVRSRLELDPLTKGGRQLLHTSSKQWIKIVQLASHIAPLIRLDDETYSYVGCNCRVQKSKAAPL